MLTKQQQPSFKTTIYGADPDTHTQNKQTQVILKATQHENECNKRCNYQYSTLIVTPIVAVAVAVPPAFSSAELGAVCWCARCCCSISRGTGRSLKNNRIHQLKTADCQICRQAGCRPLSKTNNLKAEM